MKKKIVKAAPPPPQSWAFDWRTALVTLLVVAAAFGVVGAQFRYTRLSAEDPARYGQYGELSLANLNNRVALLESATNDIQRDELCVPLAASCRSLDAELAPDARVFVAGMLGPTNVSKTGYYFFLEHYLFPRDVEISLNGRATQTFTSFVGVPCESPEVLKTNGFDLMIGDQFQLIPLTPKGVPRE